MQKVIHNRLLISIICIMLLAAVAAGQEIRATLSGSVVDSSGAGVPKATVTVTNIATGLRTTTTTGDDGSYAVPQLPPGPYELRVEAQGFRTFLRQGISLNTGDKVRMNVTLDVGALTESVTVTADVAQIETNQSVLGQVMDGKKVSELPLNGRNYLMLLQLSAGVIFTARAGPGGWSGTRQWESGPGVGQFTMHGSLPGTNAFFVDGAPQGMEGGTSNIPLLDAVEEFKVVSPTSDASQGLSGGGVVHVTMKSGTNEFHGLASDFLRNNVFDAVETQTKRAAAQKPELLHQKHQWNNFSGLLSGPVIKNKLFFSGNYDGFRERVPRPVTISVPTMAQRAGDFSETRNAAGDLIVIYDPLSTRQEGSRFVRDPFAGNRIPAGRQSRVAQNIFKYFPEPNTVTDPVTGALNYAATNNTGKHTYDGMHLKFDYYWNPQHRTSASTANAFGNTYASDNGIPLSSPVALGGHGPSTRDHRGAIVDHVWTARATTVVNARLSWDRWFESAQRRASENFDGSTLGMQGRVASTLKNGFPGLYIENYGWFGNGVKLFHTYDTYAATTDVSQTIGRHLLKTGVRFGFGRYNYYWGGDLYGVFHFFRGWTQRDPQRADTTSGNGAASMLLGYPGGGGTDFNAHSTRQNEFFSLYIQDDFRVTPRLTLNFGLRWDVQTPSRERFNRMIVGFDPNVTYTLGAAQAKGGLVFAGDNRRSAWQTRWRDLQPRFGVAYQAAKRIVLRSSYGISFLPNNGTEGGGSIIQTGFSRRTPFISTLGGGLDAYIPGRPGTGTLEYPFPNGILEPYGASLGAKTNLGQSITFTNPDFVLPRVHQFQFGFELELPFKSLLEVSYVGSRTRKLPVSRSINYISTADREKAIADPNYLTKGTPNPFAGAPELAGTSLAGANVTTATVLLPYPQFPGGIVRNWNPIGRSSYNALETRFNKRLSHGLSMTAAYTWAKTIEERGFREAQYDFLDRVLAPFDRTHHFTLAAVYELPIGKGKLIGRNWGSALNTAFGGWQYNFTAEAMSGVPLSMPDATPVRDPRLPSGQQNWDRYFNTCTMLTNGARTGCISADEPVTWMQLKPYEFRRFSWRFPNLREPWRPQYNMSMFKFFPVKERFTIEFRAEAFNAFNTPIYPAPDLGVTSTRFGKVTRDQVNFPRNLQFALRVKF